jgi:hypothetical protein
MRQIGRNFGNWKNYRKIITGGVNDITKGIKLPPIKTDNEIKLDSEGNKKMLLGVGGGLAALLVLWALLFKKKSKKREY